MSPSSTSRSTFLRSLPPFDRLAEDLFEDVLGQCETLSVEAGTLLYGHGDELGGLYLPLSGKVEIARSGGERLSVVERGGMFGIRGLLRGGKATNRARVL